MLLKLKDLEREAQLAFVHGQEYLLSHTLPSMWDSGGVGWQEHWRAANAGFYASCDGILILSSQHFGLPESGDKSLLISKVYSGHLCQVLDKDVLLRSPEQERMRVVCSRTVFKLSKFIQASSRIDSLTLSQLRVLSDARSAILKSQRPEGGWPACIDKNRSQPIAVSATCEAAIALALTNSSDSSDALRLGVDFLAQTLQKKIDRKRSLAALWALSEVFRYIEPPDSISLGGYADLVFSSLSDLSDDLLTDTFSNPLGNGDYYNLNIRLLGAQTILNLILLGVCAPEAACQAAAVVQGVTSSILRTGQYLRDDSAEGPRFWEHYQAMTLLETYLRSLEAQPKISENNFMWVSPKHFEPKNFATENDYAVVLMPFTPAWSADVFEAFKEAAQGRGFRVWRSDVSFKDEKIMQRIWEEMCRARFIIADCTGRNPNVFYELGIAHTLGKPVFICAQKRKDIPFDLNAIRSFDYGGAMKSQLRSLQSSLSSFIDDL